MPEIVTKSKVSIIGVGAMGSTLVTGFLNAGLVTPENVLVSDPRRASLEALQERFPVKGTTNNSEVIQDGGIVVCAVKPAQIKAVLEEISPLLTPEHLLVSIAAGISLKFLETHLPPGVPVVRAMPNVPAMIGEGMTALALGESAGEDEREAIEALFRAVGKVITLSEENLDAVTGLSGCGPGYIAVIIEALADGGVKAGLPRQVAMDLTIQTVLGTARMLQSTGDHPGELKDRVSSPGGSTISGLHVLEKGGLRGLLISAVETATKRSGELQS